MGNRASSTSRAQKKERDEARQKTMKAASAAAASAIVKAVQPTFTASSSANTAVVIPQSRSGSLMPVHVRLSESLNRDGKEFIKQELIAMYCLMSQTPLTQAEDAAKALTVVELRAAIRLMVAGAIVRSASNDSEGVRLSVVKG